MCQAKFLLIFIVIEVVNAQWSFVGNPLLHAHPCPEHEEILLHFEPNLPPEDENQYGIHINIKLPAHSRIYLKFDSEASVKLDSKTEARLSTIAESFIIQFFKQAEWISFTVKGPVGGPVPYLTSVQINNQEYCQNYTTGFLDDQIQGYKDTAELHLSVPDDTCGRRKIQHTELITNSLATKPGDWPWHVAIYRIEKNEIKYICGGTLLSKRLVLTAAHCTTIRGAPVLPETLSVVLGKYNLIGGDVAAQEREINEVIVHEEFKPNHLENDIAFLKLKSEADLNDYVQPACLWYKDVKDKLPKGELNGTIATGWRPDGNRGRGRPRKRWRDDLDTYEESWWEIAKNRDVWKSMGEAFAQQWEDIVVGWGFDQTDHLSTQLRQATIPKVSDSTCIKSNPLFFGKLLNDRKFCAGWRNGTSACNGDSGGGFTVFVPDSLLDTSSNPQGAWYIRGIVSLSLSRKDVPLCDPSHYVIFTDVAKYKGWIKKYLQ